MPTPLLLAAAGAVLVAIDQLGARPDPARVVPAVGYLGLLLFDIGAWLALLAVVPGLGSVLLGGLGLLVVAPLVGLLLLPVLVVLLRVAGLALLLAADFLSGRRRDGRAGMVLASA